MSDLPKDCALPVGVEWCGESAGGPWFYSTYCDYKGDENEYQGEDKWSSLLPHEQAYVAARCAMWWRDRWNKGNTSNVAYEAYSAWQKLWRELEDENRPGGERQMMTHEEKIDEWKCEAERCVHHGWETEIYRLRAALVGCIEALRSSAKVHKDFSNASYGRYCEGCAKLAQETLEGK